MLPIQDITPTRPPYVNCCLLALIFIIFIWELSLGSDLPRTAQGLGFVPARFLEHIIPPSITLAILPSFLSLFLHANLLHLAPNVCFLAIFGPEVENTLGHGRYLLFYLVGGVGSNLVYLLFAPFSPVPLIGASGAIAGVMAAYFSVVPGTRLTDLFIIIWVLLQFIYAVFSSVNKTAGQVGMVWWAHVGGFLIGLVLVRLMASAGLKLIPFRSEDKKPPQD